MNRISEQRESEVKEAGVQLEKLEETKDLEQWEERKWQQPDDTSVQPGKVSKSPDPSTPAKAPLRERYNDAWQRFRDVLPDTERDLREILKSPNAKDSTTPRWLTMDRYKFLQKMSYAEAKINDIFMPKPEVKEALLGILEEVNDLNKEHNKEHGKGQSR